MPAKTKINIMATQPATEAAGTKFYRKPIFWAGIAVLLLLLASAFLAWQNHKLKNNLANLQNQLKSSQVNNQSNPNDFLAQEDKQLVEVVGKLMILPSDEAPTIATVTDLEKLKGQPFFANAAVGDKVLIYAKAQKAILYRPSEDKIIELAPLSLGSGQTTPAAAKLKVEIRNGSGKTGAAGVFKTKLLASGNFDVVKTGNAKTTYPKTLLYVADINTLPDLVNSLRLLASAQLVTSLPAGEPASTADALLILGQQ